MRLRSSTEANSTVSLPLRWPSAMLTRVSKRSDSRAARSSSWGWRVPGPRAARLGPLLVAAESDDLLDAADRQALGHDALREPLHRRAVLEGQQRPGMAGAEHPGGNAARHERRQLQQPQRVGDLRAGPPDAAGELVVRAAEVLEQLLVGRRLLEGVELAAVEVLQQRVAQQVVVVGLLDDGGDRLETGLLGGAPAPLAHDELEARLAVLTCRQRDGRRWAAARRSRGCCGPARPCRPRRRRCAAGGGWAGSPRRESPRTTRPAPGRDQSEPRCRQRPQGHRPAGPSRPLQVRARRSSPLTRRRRVLGPVARSAVARGASSPFSCWPFPSAPAPAGPAP